MNVVKFFRSLRSLKVAGKTWFSEPVFEKRFEIGKWKIKASMRSKNGWMGRFGGGWQVKFGFQLGSSTLLISLFVMEIAIVRTK